MTAIAIIGAMDEEVANIATALSNVTVTEEAGVKVTRGTLETNKGTAVNVAATVGGMGTVNIAATTQHLIDADQPDAVIFSGIAGNLNTNLHINDVVLGGTLRYLDTDMRLVGQFKPGTADRPIEEYHSDDRLLELADQALNDLNIHQSSHFHNYPCIPYIDLYNHLYMLLYKDHSKSHYKIEEPLHSQTHVP